MTICVLDLNLQRDAFVASRCEKFFDDVGSGELDSRNGLTECLDYDRAGDTLVAMQLNRMGRSFKPTCKWSATLKGARSQALGVRGIQCKIL